MPESSHGRHTSATSEVVDQRGESALQRGLMSDIDSGSMLQRQRDQIEAATGHPLQKMEDEEEMLQGKLVVSQREALDEEELMQGKFDGIQRQPEEEELLQGKFEGVQREVDEEELLQGKFASPLQREEESAAPNETGLPDNLKSGIESLGGVDISDVRVHYNSSKPSQLNARAYAQGSDIHLASGQQKHLPHEAWHTVQQRQGRVQPTMEMGGEKINDDAELEREADVMGEKALQYKK